MPFDPLIPADVLDAHRAELVRRIQACGLPLTVDIEADDEAARALARSLLFAHWPELAGVEADVARCFYNRYFWFVRFITLHQRTHGPDAGLEQQAFHLFEEVEGMGGAIDLQALEDIDARARRAT
jgi:hypothetical protein